MAKTNSSLRIKSAGNPFTKDKSLAAMKKRWSSMTPAQRKSNVKNFRSAAKGKPKSQPVASQPSAQSRRKKAFDGVGPSDAQRTKDSSPEAMAAERNKRKTNFDGVGPSDVQRRKDSSAEAMKPKQHKGGARSRPTGNARNKSTPKVGATKTVKKYNSRGRAIGTVTQMWNGKKWVTGKLGSKGAKG